MVLTFANRGPRHDFMIDLRLPDSRIESYWAACRDQFTMSGVTASCTQSQQLPRMIPRKKPAPQQNILAAPEAPSLPAPPDPKSIVFQDPGRRILTAKDLELFEHSSTHSLLLSFVFSLADSAADKKISSVPLDDASPIVGTILSILLSIEEIIVSCPPADQGSSRFGNASFRLFLDALSSQNSSWHNSLGLAGSALVSEVSTYLSMSFGNRARIDYGSGHELNFVTWLLCLNRLSLLGDSDFSAVTLIVFPRYVQLMRKLQSTYYLEPAGSHGVWGLDDYHFLPFLIGASQLLHHPYIRPLSIHNELVLEEEGDEYLYLDMIRWTTLTKSVKGLKWTQPMLDDISGAKNWGKVEQGMRKMFMKEVLGKLPVMQHFLFGSLVPAIEGMSLEVDAGLAPEKKEEESGELAIVGGETKHVHRDNAWGDCCGIKIPSTVAAAQEVRKHTKGEELRRIPFD